MLLPAARNRNTIRTTQSRDVDLDLDDLSALRISSDQLDTDYGRIATVGRENDPIWTLADVDPGSEGRWVPYSPALVP